MKLIMMIGMLVTVIIGSVIKIRREDLRSLIQVKVKSAVETVRREEMRSMSRSLVGESNYDVFTTRYCAALRWR